MVLTYSLIFLTLTFNVIGNIMLKIGVTRMTVAHDADQTTHVLAHLNGTLVLGAASFGIGLLCYITVLSRVPLNLAQTVFSLQFVAVILMANIFLDEPISALRWLGIGIIFLGLLIVAGSASP